MHYWAKSFPNLIDNVAADEAVLDWAQDHQTGPIMRLWESSEYGVVLGYGNRRQAEVKSDVLRDQRLPVVRRCSGGGTVVQGPGCFNYCFILPVTFDARINSISGTTSWVMGQMETLFQALVSDHLLHPDNPLAVGDPAHIAVLGDSDLTVNGIKFSGNAQRRRKTHVMFHGTILSHFDLGMVTATLNHPSREPGYRHGRSHQEFITNVGIPFDTWETAMTRFFRATDVIDGPPDHLVTDLVMSRYTTLEWMEKF